MDNLAEATALYKRGGKYGYWQVETSERDHDRTDFTSQHELCRFTGMPFRLKHVLLISQRALDIILVSVQLQFAVVYLYDIVMLLKSPYDLVEEVARVLRLLYKAGDTLMLKKCKFCTEKIVYLNHVRRPVRLELANYTTDARMKQEHLTTWTELCSFLGLSNVLQVLYTLSPPIPLPLTNK